MTSNELTTTQATALVELTPEDYKDENKCNPIFYTQSLLQQLPAGVEPVPYVVQLPARDIWTSQTAGGVLKGKQAMLSAQALSRIAQAAGIKLRRVTEEFIDMPMMNNQGQHYMAKLLRIEYEASMMLPDGTVITEIGGKEEKYSIGDSARERIDTKARRNALKRLMNLPTSMDVDQLKKPMVIWKFKYHKGGDVDHVVDSLQGAKTDAIKQLYGGTVDVTTRGNMLGYDELLTQLNAATTPDELRAVGELIEDVPLSKSDRKDLVLEWQARRDELAQPVVEV